MKKYITVLGLVLMLDVFAVGCHSIKKWGTGSYYVQITTDGQLQDNNRYEYRLKGFDEEGTEKEMLFDAERKLKKDAFLKVYYDKDKGVKTWEEVKKDDIPEKAKINLGVQ
ncbi:YxeA family protein [Bacillus sp. ISL-8]|nr:YxeA family protein [Bacillus sp. ISL-8]